MALQMSLMGAMPVTKDNLIHILNAKEPLDYGRLLDELGYDINEDREAWSKAYDQIREILQPMCKRGEAYYTVYLDWVQHEGRTMGVYNHKFSLHRLPEACGSVRGYEALDPDGDEDENEDMDVYKQVLKKTKKKEARKA